MFARVKTSRHGEYLQIVESYREDGKVRQRLVLYVGHYRSVEDALTLLPREISYLRGRATRAGQVESGPLREAAKEAAARLEALKRILAEHPDLRERDHARMIRHSQRQREAASLRREARRRSDQQA
jgi:hypothetical protein